MLKRPRIIPTLLIENRKLIKTVNFKNPRYLGDPINALRIFNEIGVDELCIIDKSARKNPHGIDFDYLKKIASEAFMPLSYSGGINTLDEIIKIVKLGFEKVILNTAVFQNPYLIQQGASVLGSQSIVVSIDYKKTILGNRISYINNGKKSTNKSPLDISLIAQNLGAGEIILTSIDHEGRMSGYDFEYIEKVANLLNIPLVASGGASSINDIYDVIHKHKADAATASSIFVYYGKNRAVLINFPDEKELIENGVYVNE